MSHASTQRHFDEAVDALVAQVKDDRSILAAILCGSLSHDTVWAKSDIDLVLVTIDDKKVERRRDLAVRGRRERPRDADVARASFARSSKGAIRNSFMHSFLAKGRLLYTHDETIADLLRALGRHRRARHAGSSCFAPATQRAAVAVQGAQVASHARRSRLHGALDSLRGRRRWRRIEVISAPPARRPGGHPAGDEAESRVLHDDLHRYAQHKEDEERRSGGARRDRRLHRRARRRRCSRRSSTICARWARRGRATEIEDHFAAQLRHRERHHRVRVPRRPGHRSGRPRSSVGSRSAATSTCRSWRSSIESRGRTKRTRTSGAWPSDRTA